MFKNKNVKKGQQMLKIFSYRSGNARATNQDCPLWIWRLCNPGKESESYPWSDIFLGPLVGVDFWKSILSPVPQSWECLHTGPSRWQKVYVHAGETGDSNWEWLRVRNENIVRCRRKKELTSFIYYDQFNDRVQLHFESMNAFAHFGVDARWRKVIDITENAVTYFFGLS